VFYMSYLFEHKSSNSFSCFLSWIDMFQSQSLVASSLAEWCNLHWSQSVRNVPNADCSTFTECMYTFFINHMLNMLKTAPLMSQIWISLSWFKNQQKYISLQWWLSVWSVYGMVCINQKSYKKGQPLNQHQASVYSLPL